MNQTFLIVDGTNLAHRAFYALRVSAHGVPVGPDKTPIAAISTVLRSLLTVIKQHDVTHAAVCFDNDQPTFRHKLFEQYKFGRNEKDPLLVADLEAFQSLMCRSGIGIVAPPGVEADDVIATLAAQTNAKKLIYSGDRDLFQLADSSTTILYPSTTKKAVLNLTADDVRDMMQVRPIQIPDYKALRGDSTDNIIGVKGIGEKIAVDLLSRYESIEDIYQNIGKITGRIYSLLRKGKADAELSKRLAVLEQNATLPMTIEDFRFSKFDIEGIAPMLNSMGLSAVVQGYNDLFDSRF